MLLESNLPNHQTRQQIPGCIMLAALPHRRVAGERSATTPTLTETVCPNTIDVHTAGFTLVELSIVLVIIGLIVGGVLVGRDLIKQAEVRAQITQIDKYQQAVNTFKGKYGYLPGDIPEPYASQFGFQPRGLYYGEGDGDGILYGNCGNTSTTANNFDTGCGEMAVFWQDLSRTNLIDAGIQGHDIKGTNYPWTAGAATLATISFTTNPTVYQWLPQAKIGNTNFVYVYSVLGYNYFAVSSIASIGWTITSTATPGITVKQASMIDAKIDDGLPQSGTVTACYISYPVKNFYAVYASGGLIEGANNGYSNGLGANGNDCTPTTVATPYVNTNCFDNNGIAGTQTYSVSQNSNIPNCALSFKFQ